MKRRILELDAPLSLIEAAKQFPSRSGKSICIKTLKNRITKGCRGVRLRAFKDGHAWFTTLRAIREFQEACTQQAMGRPYDHSPGDANERAKELLAGRFGIGQAKKVHDKNLHQ